MENTPIKTEAAAPKVNVLFEVTTLSKILAALLFIIFPFVGFWLGITYNNVIQNNTQTLVTSVTDTEAQTPQDTPLSGEIISASERLTIPEGSRWLSAQTGVFKGYLSKKVLGDGEVLGDLAEGETVTCDTFTITEGDLSIFYKYTDEDTYVPLSETELPYEIFIGNGDIKSLPQLTQDALLASSSTTPVFALITEYVSSSGKGLDTCESEVEIFIAF